MYTTLSERGVMVKKYGVHLDDLQSRVNKCQKVFMGQLIAQASKVAYSNPVASLPKLRSLAGNVYALMHSYGVALARVRGPKVTDVVIHDPVVAKVLSFLFENADLGKMPKTFLNGYELCGVPTPKLKDVNMNAERRELFLVAKARLLTLMKTRSNTLLKTLIVNEATKPLDACNSLARDMVLLCSIMAELLSGNLPQAKFNAGRLRSVSIAVSLR
jgi:hypothetical protein